MNFSHPKFQAVIVNVSCVLIGGLHLSVSDEVTVTPSLGSLS